MERLPEYIGPSPEHQTSSMAMLAEHHFDTLIQGGVLTLMPPYLRTHLTHPGVGEVVYIDGPPGSQYLSGYKVSAIFGPYGHPELDLEVVNKGVWLIEQYAFVPFEVSDSHERRIAPLGMPRSRTLAHYDADSDLWHVARGKKHETVLKPNELAAVATVAQQTAFVMDLAALVVSHRGRRPHRLRSEAGEDFWAQTEALFEDNEAARYVIGEMRGNDDVDMAAVQEASTFEHLFIEVESSVDRDKLPYYELMQALRARQSGSRMATALSELTYNDGQWERLRKKLPLFPQKYDTPIIGVFPGILMKQHLQKLMDAAIGSQFDRIPAYASDATKING